MSVSTLEAKVGDIQGEVQLAVAGVIEGLAKNTDVRHHIIAEPFF